MTETITYEFPEEADMQAFRERPADASEGMQIKYIGLTHQEFLVGRNALKDHEGEVPEGYDLQEETHYNPFTHEEKVIKILVALPQRSAEEQINEKIKELKLKLINGTITKVEKDTLALLVK